MKQMLVNTLNIITQSKNHVAKLFTDLYILSYY